MKTTKLNNQSFFKINYSLNQYIGDWESCGVFHLLMDKYSLFKSKNQLTDDDRFFFCKDTESGFDLSTILNLSPHKLRRCEKVLIGKGLLNIKTGLHKINYYQINWNKVDQIMNQNITDISIKNLNTQESNTLILENENLEDVSIKNLDVSQTIFNHTQNNQTTDNQTQPNQTGDKINTGEWTLTTDDYCRILGIDTKSFKSLSLGKQRDKIALVHNTILSSHPSPSFQNLIKSKRQKFTHNHLNNQINNL